ncbi:MAG: transcriptional regulator, LacI family [Acidimicrobiales bacterium]|jgi:LacI family transcriptional regulator|nr:transcriptional regulator, LacI family [Acidimicrobiales bacterium]
MKDPSGRLTSLTDVARRAGVSVATASRVLSASTYPVAEKTRRRVLKAADALDFAPNLIARGLVAQRTYLVGMLVSDLVDEHAAALARGVEEAAAENGFAVLVMSTDGDPEKEIDAVRRLRSMRVDAVIFSYSTVADRDQQDRLTAQLRHVEAAGGALVRLAPHPRVGPDASISTRQGFALAVEHLVGLGHRRIALLQGPANAGLSQVGVYAMRRVLEGHRLSLADRFIIPTDGTLAGGRSAAPALLKGRAPATAVVAMSDTLAIGVLKGLADAGARVPRDISVVGFDDVPAAAYTTPGLTTVHVPLRELGSAGMQVAIWLLGGGARRGRNNLPVELVVRESTDKAPKARPGPRG